MLQRLSYLKKLQEFLGSRVIKIITGQRRVGKSTLLEQLLQQYTTSQVLVYSFDELGPTPFSNYMDRYRDIKSKITTDIQLLCVDEIQILPSREKVILSIYKEYPSIDIIITGSNSTMLSSELSTLLSGRYICFHILPFGFEEYCEYHTLSRSRESFESFLQVGGLPSLYQFTSEQTKKQWLQSLFDTIILRDIITRYALRDVALIKNLLYFMINAIADITNIQNIVNSLKQLGIKTNHITIQNYITYIKQTYLLYECPLVDIQGKKIFDRQRKWYISDHILRYQLYGGFDQGLWKSLENIVFLEGMRYGWTMQCGKIGDKEIDFVCDRNGKRIYIQIAYLLASPEVIEREYASLLQIRDQWPKYVISMDTLLFQAKEGVLHIQAWNMSEIFR